LICTTALSHFCNADRNNAIPGALDGICDRGAMKKRGAKKIFHTLMIASEAHDQNFAGIEQQSFRRRGRMPEPNASLEVSRRKRSACSSAVENFQSPQHHDGGRYQRGHRQYTFQGSDSHLNKLRFPAPSGV
jgi:hypothetical protein